MSKQRMVMAHADGMRAYELGQAISDFNDKRYPYDPEYPYREAFEQGWRLAQLKAVAQDATTVDLTDLPTDHPDHPYQNGHEDDSMTDEHHTEVSSTLGERGKRYGEFRDQAVYGDGINDVMLSSPNWTAMAPDQREALRIIANKIGRILNGDPDYSDSWHDIAGYATLVDKRLKEEGK